MKSKKGFTLIELLAVIVILGILISISTVAVNSLRKKQDEENKKNVISSILTGAKQYNADERIPVGGYVSVSELVSGNYVDFDQNKYPELLKYNEDNEEKEVVVEKEQCPNNALKIRYLIEVDGEKYNDCGCQEQGDGNTTSDEICTE
jgi:prepilin-type N-terminal cleavage/methylation domain-containing protein